MMVIFSLCAVFLLYSFTSNKKAGGFAEIVVNGQVLATLPLSTNQEYTVEQDGIQNTIAIVDGKATMVHANCPDQYCVHFAPISYTGQTIVCLPNRLVVQITGAENPAFDIMVGLLN